jgi:two-component system, cell cycle sensor histidine kinase and response regulator CckA
MMRLNMWLGDPMEDGKREHIALMFKGIYDQAPYLAGIVGLDGVVQHVNRAACELIGTEPDRVIGKPFWGAPWWTHSAAEQEKLLSGLEAAVQGEFVQFETTHIAADGTRRYMDFSLRPARDGTGRILCLIAEAWDITERKHVEEELEHTRLLLEAVLDQSPVPIAVASAPDLVMRYHNQTAADILGISDEQSYVGCTLAEVQQRQTWRDTNADGTPAKLSTLPLARALRGEATKNEEHSVIRKDGTQRWELVSGTPVYNRAGELIAGVIAFPDITERKQAEAAAKENQDRLEFVLQGADLGSWDWNFKTGTIRFNDRWTQMLGYQLDELEPNRQSWEKLVHPDDRSWVQEVLNSHLEGKTVFYQTEYRLRHKSGRWIWVLDKGRVIARDAEGNPLRMAGTHLDITERKRAEEELQASNTFLETIIEHGPFSTWISDDEGTLIRMNQACRDLLHVTDEELVGKYNVFEDNIVEEQGAIPLIKRVFEHGEQVQFILCYDSSQLRSLQLKETSQTVLEITISPVLDTQKRVVHAIIQHRDISERLRAEESLRMSEERFRRLVKNSTDVIALVNENCVVSWISGPVEEIFGFKPEEMIGTCGFNYIHPDYVERTMEAFSELVKQSGQVERVEYRLRHKSGNWFAAETVGSNLLNDPVVNGIVVNIREISERKNAELERNKLQEQLQQAMKMEAVGRLAGGVAHDFNNLLTVIAGNVELARMKLTPPDPLLQSLDQIYKASESAASLTRQLLAFSRRQIIEPKILDLNELVDSLLKMLTRIIGEDITLQINLSEELGFVKVDPGQFEQVLVNLAINARDAMPEGGQLFIETANIQLDEEYCAYHSQLEPGEFVMLAVSDTGHGMDERVKNHLFEPFFTTKAQGRGTGLGLATIFGTVKQAGGSIEVYSEVGQGTTFKIYLPRVEGLAKRLVKDKPEVDLVHGSETVLLVEDEASVRDLALIILKRLGYKVLHASNGGEAFMLLEKHPERIDLLMTDVVMPGINGRELAERLLKLHPEMKVLFTSGYTEDVIIHHGVIDENLNFIGKPYSMQALSRKIREILD